MMSSEEEKRSHCGSRGRRDDSQLLGRGRGRRRGRGRGEGEGRHDELRGGEKEPLWF